MTDGLTLSVRFDLLPFGPRRNEDIDSSGAHVRDVKSPYIH
ncbi:hypothetical protein [Rhodococcus pyridinivorans]